jgi:hypothetical protein
VVLAVLLFFAVIGLFLQGRRLADLQDRLARLTRGNDEGSLQDVLEEHLDIVARVVGDVDELRDRTARLEVQGPRAFQRIGLVRFNPFEDTGSNQSFALALLDGHDDGIVISSLHTRSATRIYAKSLAAGRADAALSEEESQAVALARAAVRGAVRGAGEGPRPAVAATMDRGTAATGRGPVIADRAEFVRERPSV